MHGSRTEGSAYVRSILVASDSFKGTIDSRGVGEAVARGWRRVHPDDEVAVVPVADGGEGTLEAIHAAVPGSEYVSVASVDPQQRPREARWLRLPGNVGVVELAETCGLGLTDPLQPLTAHTGEFGRVIAAALDAGVARLVLALGGSASTDGGVGMLTALGARFTDETGTPIPPGGGGLAHLASADLTGLRPLPEGGVTVCVDVTSPLTGAHGAARVFGPQKGATPDMVRDLDRYLGQLAEVLGADPTHPGAGAAGGTGYALQVWGASTQPGAAAMSGLLGLAGRIAASDAVITGEGAFDAQTATGKLPTHLSALAAQAGVPAMLIAGAILAEPRAFAHAVDLTALAGDQRHAMAEPARWIEAAAVQLAELF